MDSDAFLSTANVAQSAPDTVRLVPGVSALYRGCRVVGEAITCSCGTADNLALHRALQQATPGQVLVCDAGGRIDVGHFGELMGRDAQARGITGLVISGSIRDAEDLERIAFPVFCAGRAPFQSTKVKDGVVGAAISLNGVPVHMGDIIVADSDAVINVPRATWQTVRERARDIALNEERMREEMRTGRKLAEILSLQSLDS